MEDYAKPTIFLGPEGGALVKLEQIDSLEQATHSGSSVVYVIGGIGGFADGGGDVTINIGYLIPKGGTEFPFQEACANKLYVAAQVNVGDKAYVGMGKLIDDTMTVSTDKATSGSCQWIGELRARD